MADRMRACSSCWEFKNIEMFSKDKSRLHGLSYVCKDCHNKRGRDYHERKSSDKVATRYERLYALSPDEILTMLIEQDYKCKTCSQFITLERKNAFRANVDHCHVSGRVRGLLCSDCNRALGMVKDKVDTLKNMIEYLQ